ncbi:uncharacterized protein [Littorina saxatilis]|uniref:uncharacterized protein n=1 Tax=Littorina saxatilis TaxID=31220 RepID=UPI0038B50B51
MVLLESELIIPAVIVVAVLVVPVLSPAVGGWLVVLFLLLNVLLLLPLLLLMVSPRLSLSVMTAVSQMLLAPLWRFLDFHAHLSHDAASASHHQGLVQRTAGIFNMAGGGGGAGRGGGRSDGVAGWVRQAVFVLFVVLGDGTQVGVATLVTRFCFWWLGVRSFLSVLAAALTIQGSDVHSTDSPRASSDFPASSSTSSTQGVHLEDLTLYSWPFYLGQLSFAVLSLAHCGHHTPVWDLLGFVVFSVCSDQRVQHCLKLQARKLQVDFLEGFEGEVLHGLLILLDLLVCVLFFARSVRREDYPVLVLSYSNAFIALMELRVRVWQELQTGLQRMSDLRRATSVELRAHNDVCAVCLGAMSAARVTQCRHLFHGRCLRQALRVSPQCPLCKMHVVRHNVSIVDPMAEFEG